MGGYVLSDNGDARVYMYMEETDEILCDLAGADEQPQIWAYDEKACIVMRRNAE